MALGNQTAGNQTAEDQIAIAVMGPTGSGKSSFLNALGGKCFKIGHDLKSETAEVEVSEVSIDGQLITLIDTPGFNDSRFSDTKVLQLVSAYLAASFKNNKKLKGLIYLQRILDNRIGAVGLDNIVMFRKLCGDDALKNVVLCTTMWDKIDEPTGESRERELKDEFWKPMLDKGSKMLRHYGSPETALEIVRSIIPMKQVTLCIQDELVTRGMELITTAAGQEVDANIERRLQRHKEDIVILQHELPGAQGEKLQEIQDALAQKYQEAKRREREREELLKGNKLLIEELAAQLYGYKHRGVFGRLWYLATGK